jgi:Kef-type K+ transport system membrane component KefB
MIANGVGSWINLLLPVLVGLLLLGAVLGGSLLSAATRLKAETYVLRPLGVVLLAAGVFWAGHEMWRDLSVKHDNILAALHVALAIVLTWTMVVVGRRLVKGPKPPSEPKP